MQLNRLRDPAVLLMNYYVLIKNYCVYYIQKQLN